MRIVLIYTNTLIFFCLSMLHFYWTMGGKWGLATSIPLTKDLKPLFKPGLFSTLLVAFGLLFFAIIILSQEAKLIANKSFLRYGTLAIAFLFFARCIGDFSYIGLFKKIKGTPFARSDNRIYIPLCAYLALSCLLILILV